MMYKTELKKEIDILIDSIKKQADRMNIQSNLSPVELEVLHHKIQKLYEKSILIHHLPKTDFPFATPPLEPVAGLPVQQKTEIPVTKDEPGALPTPIESSIETPSTTKTSAPPIPEAEAIAAGDLFGGTIQQEIKSAKPKPEKEREKTQNKPFRKPIADLKAAIGINDKFRFINELFDGNATEFNIALNQINSCTGYEDADTYITNIRSIYKWDQDKEVVVLFLDLVERRFL
jgi:hypothetical protein